MLAWSIWKERNFFIFEEKENSPRTCLSWVMLLHQRYREVLANPRVMEKGHGVRWGTPSAGSVKVNVDAGRVGECSSLGMVVRDSAGATLMTAVK